MYGLLTTHTHMKVKVQNGANPEKNNMRGRMWHFG